jgi:hypothetical protein
MNQKTETEPNNNNKEKIVYCSQGIANRHYDKIYLHKELLKPEWSELYSYAIRHERLHSPVTHIKDYYGNIRIDSWLPLKIFWLSIKFAFKNPGAWWQFSPIRYLKGDDEKDGLLAFDPVSIIFALVIIMIIGTMLKIYVGF